MDDESLPPDWDNPCTVLAEESDHVPLYSALALVAMLTKNEGMAEEWLGKVPRAERGRLNVALEDLSMKLSRLGNR
jgi:hypothetical protein